MFVAVILVSSVMVTYSSIRYNSFQSEPQALSAIDETNLALKQVIGFTVGYYGSVLQVTGNSSYARALATNYLDSGLENIADIRPEWGSSFSVNNLELSTNWFTNYSFSEGNITVTYALTGLGISGVTYSTSCRLEVHIPQFFSSSQICLSVFKDENKPLNDLSKQNFKFYRYQYSNLTWEMVAPTEEPLSFANGTYLINVPPEINPYSYAIQVADTRGITVAASSFSHYTASLLFNSTYAEGDYVDNCISNVDSSLDKGSHSNFAAQQTSPDNIYDVLTEGTVGTVSQDYSPSACVPLNSTTLISGNLSNLLENDSVRMSFRSHSSLYYQGQYTTIGYDNANSTQLTSQGTSIQWKHTTGISTDRLLIVTIDVFNSGTPTTVTSVNYNGVPLTQVSTALYSVNPQIRSYVFCLGNPAIGTNTITATFVSATLAIGGSVTYTNVNQTVPVQAINAATGSGTSQSVSLTASGSQNKVLFGHLGSYRTSNPSSYTVSEGSGQTNLWSQISSIYKGQGSDKQSVTSGSVQMSWSTSRAASWVAIVVLLQPAQLPSECTADVEFSGWSDTTDWNSLLWTIDCSATTTVNAVFQLYNFQTGQYATSGDGYLTVTLGTTDVTKNQTIATNPVAFRDVLGGWKLKVTAVKSISSQFDVNIDLLTFRPSGVVYALDLEEQWTDVNVTYMNPRPTLCVKTGPSSLGDLKVDVWYGGSWRNILSGLASNSWNNVSVAPYLDSSTFTIRFASNADFVLSSWQIDSVLLRPESDQGLFTGLSDPSATVAVEVLQNGTMRWLGQNLQLTTQAIPIPPVPVRSIHVNQTTIDGRNVEVPFQVEDWASNYTVPLGLTNSATVFGNRQMIVFLVNTQVSKFTIWWNGSDQATQTPLAFTNTYFTGDNPDSNFLTNGKMNLQFGGSFTVTSTVVGKSTSSTANFMRINLENSVYGANPAYVIHHGIVRDIVQQEAEWSSGADNCPNIYANIVLTLPANATYFTYQLRLMFINSAQPRTITDLCPIKLSSSTIPTLTQTENGTALGDPIVASGTGTFYNYFPSTNITMHRWSQFTWGSGQGTGIMFTDSANQRLYEFDTNATAVTGSLNVSATARTIELSPVTQSLGQVSAFPTPNTYDITWSGAVVTFDGAAPIFQESGTKTGLWILAEIPPTITVVTGN